MTPLGGGKLFFISPEGIREISGKGANTEYWLEKYPDATEEIDEGITDPQRSPLSNTVYFDSDHYHDQVTRRFVYGVMCFVGSNPIGWSRKIQGFIKTSRYSTEF